MHFLLHILAVFFPYYINIRLFPGGSDGKASACNVGDLSSIPGSGRSPREENGNLLQYSCLENPIDGGEAWWATVHRVAKSWTWLSDFTFTFIREIQGKTWWDIISHYLEWLLSKGQEMKSVAKDVLNSKCLSSTGRNINCVHYEKEYMKFSQKWK